MENKNISLKTILKIMGQLTYLDVEYDYVEPNFKLCSDDYAEYCKNLVNNLIKLDDYNLINTVANMYYRAVNTADSLIENKQLMLDTLKKFDENLSNTFNDQEELNKYLIKFNNIVQFIQSMIDDRYNFTDNYVFTEYDSYLEITDKSILYLFLDIANNLDKFSKFSQHSFNSVFYSHSKDKKVDLNKDLIELIVNNYSEKSDYIKEIIDKYIIKVKPKNKSNSVDEKDLESDQTNDEEKELEIIKPLYNKNLEQEVTKKIIGQNDAIKQIVDRLKATEFGISRKAGAKAVYMLLGPTGVGKTETVKIISNILRKDEPLIRIDMSEYKESHMASKILGSPPGYIGHDTKHNVLEVVKNNPHSFILIDEIEKAHPTVVDLFLHMFDEGKAKDSHQQTIDLSNNVFFITSNIGVEETQKNTIGFTRSEEPAQKSYSKSLKKHFRPEFINRINEIVVFNPLDYQSVYDIINLRIEEMKEAFLIQRNIKINISLTESAYIFLISKMDFNTYGAREIKRILEKYLLNNIVDYLISSNSKNINIVFENIDNDIVLKPIKNKVLTKKIKK